MGLTPQQKMMNYRERLRDNPERYEKHKLRDRERKKKTRLTWSKQKKKLENKKNRDRIRQYRLTLSYAKELKETQDDSFVKDKTEEEILHHLKEKELSERTSNAFSSTPVRNPLLPTDVKTPHTLKKIKGTFNSASKAITSTPATPKRTPKYVCSIKKKKAYNKTPARTSFSASKAIKATPARTPVSVSKNVNSTPLSIRLTAFKKKKANNVTPARTPYSASKAIKSTPARTPVSVSKNVNSTPLSIRLTAFKANKPTLVRTPFSSSKKKTLNEKNKNSPLLLSEYKIKQMALKEKIEEFFLKHTWLCRRDRRLKINPRVLMIPLKSLYETFCDENPDLCVSMQKFNSLKPPKLQVVKKVDFNAFLSVYGGSSKVISEILNVFVELPEQLRNLMCLNICDQNKKTCRSGTCKKCPFHENISSTNEMEDKLSLRDDKSTMNENQSKMNIIEKFVIGAFTPPPDMKPLQFHEVSKLLQTRLQESKKNVHVVKIIQGANKSPKLQIQVEKKIKKQSDVSKENQAQEIEVLKTGNKENTVSKTSKDTKSNNNAVKGSKKGKVESQQNSSTKKTSEKHSSLTEEKSDKQLLDNRKSNKAIEVENVNIEANSKKKELNNEKKDKSKTKVDKKVESPKKGNSRAKKTDKLSDEIQDNTDEKVNKKMKTKNKNNQEISENENNKKIKDGPKKSVTKENEEDTKLSKKALQSKGKPKKKNDDSTDEKTKEGLQEQNVHNKDNSKDESNKKNKDGLIKSSTKENEEDAEVPKKALQSRGRQKKKTDDKIIQSPKKGNSNPRAKKTDKVSDEIQDNTDEKTNKEMKKQTVNNQDNSKEKTKIIKDGLILPITKENEADTTETKKAIQSRGKPKKITETVLKQKQTDDSVAHKQRETHQSKITTFLSAESSKNNNSVKNIPNKAERERNLENLVMITIEKVIHKYTQDGKGPSENEVDRKSEQKPQENENVSKKNIEKDRLNKLKKVRRSIVSALNESANDELDIDVISEVNRENETNRKRKSLIISPSSNNDVTKTPAVKKRRTETQDLESDKLNKEMKPKKITKNKQSNSKNSPEKIEQKEFPRNKQKVDAEDKIVSSGIKDTKKNNKTKNVASEKAKEPNTAEEIIHQEKNKLDKIIVSDSEELVHINNEIEKDSENTDLSKKIIDKEKLKMMKKVRRSIVGQLNESALSEMDLDLVEEIDKENKDDNKKTQPAKKNNKPPKKALSEVPTIKKKMKTDKLDDMDLDLVKEIDKENKDDNKKTQPAKKNSKSNKKAMSEVPTSEKEIKADKQDNKKNKKNAKTKEGPKTKKNTKAKETESTKHPLLKEMAQSSELNNRAAAEAKARELLMPEDCPITAKHGTMKYLEQRSTLLKAIDDQRESDGDIFNSNIFKRRSGVSNLLDSDNIDDTLSIRTPNCKGTIETSDGTSPFTPRTGMFANWADLSNVSTHKTPTVKAFKTPTVDTEHKKVVKQVTYHMQKNKRRGIRKLPTPDESTEKVGPKSRKKNKSLIDLPNMPEEEIDDLGDEYFF